MKNVNLLIKKDDQQIKNESIKLVLERKGKKSLKYIGKIIIQIFQLNYQDNSIISGSKIILFKRANKKSYQQIVL